MSCPSTWTCENTGWTLSFGFLPLPQGGWFWLLLPTDPELSDQPQDVGCCPNCSGPRERGWKVWAACGFTVQGEPRRGAEEEGVPATPGVLPLSRGWRQLPHCGLTARGWPWPQPIRWPAFHWGPLSLQKLLSGKGLGVCVSGETMGSPLLTLRRNFLARQRPEVVSW